MNRTQLATLVAEKAGLSKSQADKYVNAVLGCIADNLYEGDGEVAIPDFGRFYVKSVPARVCSVPGKQEKIEIEAHDKVVFKASNNLGIYSRKHSAE